LEALQCSELQPTAKPVKSFVPVKFLGNFRVSKGQTKTNQFQIAVVNEVYQALLEHFSIFSGSLAFPELVLPTTRILRKFVKETKVQIFSKKLKSIVDVLESTSKMISNHRKTIEFSPKSVPEDATLKEKSPVNQLYQQFLHEKEKIDKLKETEDQNDADEQEEYLEGEYNDNYDDDDDEMFDDDDEDPNQQIDEGYDENENGSSNFYQDGLDGLNNEEDYVDDIQEEEIPKEKSTKKTTKKNATKKPKKREKTIKKITN